MKKFLPYILGFLLFAGLLFIVSTAKKPKRVADERITLREKDKIPYGFYVARKLLPSMFPDARIFSGSKEPGDWEGINTNTGNQLVVLTGTMINADRSEIEEMLRFVRKGNYLFIIAESYGYEMQRTIDANHSYSVFSNQTNDSLSVSLNEPRFPEVHYGYPGKKFSGYFTGINNNNSLVLGRDDKMELNFIQLRAGEGSLFINLCPPAFTNYFLLYRNNIGYYERAFSLIPKNVETILWSEYYFSKKPKEKEPNWLGVLLKYPAFRAGLELALIVIIFYLLMEMRRKQRYIPVFQKPTNDSLDFVQTIGRLYYDKKDHLDLARKMSSYFLDHIREKYHLQTEQLDHDFIASLQGKTGYDLAEIKRIVEFVNFLHTAPAISESQLARFHDQLETFYKNT